MDIFIAVLLIISTYEASGFPYSVYQCTDGNTIRRHELCDGSPHCPDQSDELGHICMRSTCDPGMFQCKYGACIGSELTCNGRIDCADGSDEVHCSYERIPCSVPDHSNGYVSSLTSFEDYRTIICDDNCNPRQFNDHSYDSDYNLHRLRFDQTFNDKRYWMPRLPVYRGSFNLAPNAYIPPRENRNVLCPAIVSTRLLISCQSIYGDDQGRLPCNEPLPEGTIARYQCKPYYWPKHRDDWNNTSSTCKSDGTWSQTILDCKPECGKRGTEVIPLIVHGFEAKNTAWPWVVAMYANKKGSWSHWCGATLISDTAVATAAHCVWKKPAKMFRLAFGKFYRDYHVFEEHTQIRNVLHIISQPEYFDQLGDYSSDIAVLIVEPVIISNLVQPVCIDWDGSRTPLDLGNGNLGVVAGWGINKKTSFPVKLQVTQLPLVTNRHCRKKQKSDFKKYVTYSSFCAGFLNGTAVCNGDSGGGLVFPKKGTHDDYVLQGIVSVSPRRQGTSLCDPFEYTIFTKVAMFLPWLESVLKTSKLEAYPEPDEEDEEENYHPDEKVNPTNKGFNNLSHVESDDKLNFDEN